MNKKQEITFACGSKLVIHRTKTPAKAVGGNFDILLQHLVFDSGEIEKEKDANKRSDPT